jgi:hypothetical protein
MSNSAITISSISVIAANGLLATQTLSWLRSAGDEIQFARDPQTLGSEPHLRMDVDPCGFDDDGLQALDNAVWIEISDRERSRSAPLRMAA